MKFLKLVRYDLTHGFLKSSYRLIWIAIIMACSCISFRKAIAFGLLNDQIFENGSFIDYYLYAMRGMETYRINQEAIFRIPIYWFVFHILIAYCVGGYVENNLENQGRYVMLKYGNRTVWWISKCVWCILYVLMFYLSAMFGIFFFCIINHVDISFTVSIDILKKYAMGVDNVTDNELIVVGLILPIVLSCAISLLQIALSLLLDSVSSYAFICIIYIFSAYYTSPLLIGNYSMWMRSDAIAIGTHIYPFVGFALSIFLSALSVTGGMIIVEGKDLL